MTSLQTFRMQRHTRVMVVTSPGHERPTRVKLGESSGQLYTGSTFFIVYSRRVIAFLLTTYFPFPYSSSSTLGEVLCRHNEGPTLALVPVSAIILFIESQFNAASLLKVEIDNLGNESLIRTMPFHFIFFYSTFSHWCN